MAKGSDPALSQAQTPRRLELGIAELGVASTLFLPGVERSPHAAIVAAARCARLGHADRP